MEKVGGGGGGGGGEPVHVEKEGRESVWGETVRVEKVCGMSL